MPSRPTPRVGSSPRANARSGSAPNDSLLVRYLVDQTPPPMTIAGPSIVSRGARRGSHLPAPCEQAVSVGGRVDGRPGKRCGTHYLTPTLHAGRHALHVAAKHPAGNRGTATKRFRLVTR